MRINLTLDPEQVTVDALIRLEDLVALPENQLTARAMVEALMHFVVDENGCPIEPAEARRLLGALTVRQLMEALSELGRSFHRLREAAVPPALSGS